MSSKLDSIIEKVRARMNKINPAERQVQHVYCFKVTVNGKVIKSWVLDLKAIKLYEGECNADCTLICDDDTMFEIFTGKLTPKDAIEQAKLKVEGDVALGAKLIPFIAEL